MEAKEGMEAFGGREAEEQSRGRPVRTKMTLGSGSVLPRKGESLHGFRPSTWCLHLRRVSSRAVIQSQDAEGVANTWVQAPQRPAPALRLDVPGCRLPGPGCWAAAAGPALHQEARQVPGALDGPPQQHL